MVGGQGQLFQPPGKKMFPCFNHSHWPILVLNLSFLRLTLSFWAPSGASVYAALLPSPSVGKCGLSDRTEQTAPSSLLLSVGAHLAVLGLCVFPSKTLEGQDQAWSSGSLPFQAHRASAAWSTGVNCREAASSCLPPCGVQVSARDTDGECAGESVACSSLLERRGPGPLHPGWF